MKNFGLISHKVNTLDTFPKCELSTKPETTTILGLSHQEINSLTDYSITTIRSKASLGKSITTKDGVTYRYNKDPEVLKWVKV
ncbi:hypothetical protein [Nostoc sp.]|uniref:hypothetical protein n=1 Tax=Nostoc sp. TaxID=1180 RepID=UPI002FFCA3E6